jgi:addiction module RelE/StbE family toxin
VRLEWGALAISDREAIFDYIAPDNLDAAIQLDELFREKAELVASHPEAGRSGRVRGTRELVAHPHYVLVYDTTPDRTRILRVLHTARLWPPARRAGKARKSK